MKRLSDDVRGSDLCAKQHCGTLCDLSLLLIVEPGPASVESSNYFELWASRRTRERGDPAGLGPAPAVCVQFIQHKEAQALCRFYGLLLINAGKMSSDIT